MNNKEMIGMLSAWTTAKEMPYGSNMTISAALVVEMVERIIELEAKLQTAQSDKLDAIAKERKRWGREDLAALEIRDLEQQAKGVEDAKEYYSHKWVDEFEDVTVNIMKKGEGYIYPEGLGEYSSELYNRAKALKEPKP
jgi:hypothetical protein